jgi:hypothetical protein
LSNQPALSILLATPDNFATLRRTVDALRRQTIAGELELIFIIQSAGSLNATAGELAGFHSHQIVEHPVAGRLAEARAAGIRAARSPFVVIGEDHSFPHRRWAERLVAAHRRGYRVVGATLCNPRPKSSIGWADMISSFLPYIHPARGGVCPMLPGHNTSYDRELLMAQGERLADFMQSETVLHLELSGGGEKLWLERKALATHFNLVEPTRFIYHKWLGGILFGAIRSREWPLGRRVMHGLLAPVIPGLRLWRMRHGLAWLHKHHHCVVRAFPWLVVALVCHGAGEGIGTLFGEGNALSRYWRFEFHRLPVERDPSV